MWERLKTWLHEPVHEHDETDWETYGRTFGPKVGSAREPRNPDSSAVRRWNQADVGQGRPMPRWVLTLVYALVLLTALGVFWWLSTIPMPDR